MIQVQVFISSLLLLLPGAVDSDAVVKGVAGHPVTLPCIYSTDHGVTSTCWGKGECQYVYCARTLIWTNGYQVTYQSSRRYQLKGNILEGNVSLTIENAVQSDSGPYCCVVEMPGAFRHMTYSLEVEPEIPVSPPMNATTTSTINTTRANTTGRPMATARATATERPTTTSTRLIHVPTSTRVSTSTPPTPANMQTKPGAVDSDAVVKGVAGYPVTLPCNYSTDHGVTSTCWGKGECQYVYCARTLIWTNGYQVTYQSSRRYQLKGNILEGNVSLTIENAVQSDSGPYCCVVEMPGAFRHMTYSLEVEPEIPESPTMNARTTSTINTTRPNTKGRRMATARGTVKRRPMTTSTRPAHVPISTRVSTFTPPTPVHMQTKRGAVDSDAVVKGVAGHPVTLPCIYSTDHGVTSTCWGKGECQYVYCARTLIWTNGYQVTYQSSRRYQLKGNILEGNVSLTIENAVQSDSGPYCCVVEMPGAFRHMTYSLEVEPEIPVSPPMNARTTSTINTTRANTTGRRMTTARATATRRPMTTSTRPTHVPTSTRVSTSTPPTTANMQTKRDCDNTVTSSKDVWSYNTKPILMGKVEKDMTKGFYAAIAIAALLLLLLLGLLVVIRLMLTKRKSESPSLDAFLVSRIETLQNTAIVVPRGEDKVYVIEDSPCLANGTLVAF